LKVQINPIQESLELFGRLLHNLVLSAKAPALMMTDFGTGFYPLNP